MRTRSCVVVLAVCCVAALVSPCQAQSDPISAWLAAINSARLRAGASPCELSPKLSAAAQRHANDLAANMMVTQSGSDGSTPQQRITEAGYFPWSDAKGQPVIGEAVVSSAGGVDEAVAALLQDPASRDAALNPLFREIGIGVASDAAGRFYYVLDLGARPNVLPIFINDGAYNTLDPQVAIHLTNEEARPEGQGVAIGRVIEIRISNEPNWEGLPWQPWEEFVPWVLPDEPGEHIVYVQLRDAAGRTVSSADSILLGEGEPPTLAPVLLTPVATPEGEAAPNAGGDGQPTPVATPAAVTLTLSPAPALTITPFPTWTPLPTPAPPPPVERPRLPLGLVAGLQAVAVLLGLYLALRRGRRADSEPPDDQSP
jgi:hypothetical protein